MKKLLLLGLIATFMCNCAKEKAPEPDNLSNGPKSSTKSYLISMDSLQNLALQLPDLFRKKTSLTRSSSRKMIQEVVPLSDFVKLPATKSGDNSTKDIYVVNYDDQQGFAILSADTRMEQVLAYSDQGTISESTDNPGLKVFMDMIPDYAQEKISRVIKDSILGPYEEEEWDLIRVDETDKGPYVPLKWGQGGALNLRTPGCSDPETNGHCPIGCVPLAMIHIMAAHRAPQVVTLPDAEAVYGGTYTLDWSLYEKDYQYSYMMLPTTNEAKVLSNFALYVGRKVKARYYCAETGAKLKEANYALRAYFGFQTDNIYSYHWDRVKEDIDNGRPLIISASATSNWIGYSDAHCWVIDGFKELTNVYATYLVYYNENGERYKSEYTGEIRRHAGYWVHCNWGWDGDGNGYYLSGVFHTGTPQRLDNNDAPATGDERHYRYEMEVIKNIRR